ncbi:MAG: T9SS type A sorting domain-containing protein [Bacteroidetes bacterium]|nr:T9SS type A sorting domain-containing protein [Bacteroidota bacterium]
MKKSLLLLLALVFFVQSKAQLTTNYPATNGIITVGTYVDLGTNGTTITTANYDDALSSSIPIGFTFNYNGNAFTDFIFSTNGFIKLGTTAPSTSALYYPGPQGTAPPTGGLFNSTNTADVNMIAAFCMDLIGATGVEYRYYTSGSVGSRVCTIQWKNITEKASTVLTQYSNFSFQIKLYEGSNMIDVVYGTATSSTNASAFKSAIVGIKGASNASTEIVSVTKGSVTAWNGGSFAAGNYTGNSFNFGNSVGASRPLPTPGTTYTFVPVYANDLAVLTIYTLGKLPKQYVTPQYIRARVKNSGTAIQTNFKVYLQVRGVNSFDDSVTIASLASNTDITVSFAGYTSYIDGIDTIKVFVNPDNNNLNNLQKNIQLVNDVIYAYADPTIPAAGGVGFTGGTGQFCAKFPYSGITNSVNQIGVNFFGGGIPLQVGIWGKNATNGGPGTLLWSSAQFTSVTGLNTVPVNPPVSVSDTFFVGVIQPTTNNSNFAYQPEIPVRDKTFFYGPLNTTTWTDFSTASSNFRFMIEPRFQSPNDVGAISIDYPCQIVPLGQGSLYPFVTIYNYGLLSQTNVPVTCQIYLNNTAVYTSTTSATTLASGASTQVNFPTLFAPTQAGIYTIKSWTNLTGDASAGNDTASSTLQIVDYSGITDAGIRVQFDGVDDHISVPNTLAFTPGSMFTLEGWFNPTAIGSSRVLVSKDSSATALSYNLTLSPAGNIVFTVSTSAGVVSATSSSVLSAGNWYHVAATYDAANINVYINGALVGTAAQTGFLTSNNGPLYLARTGGAAPQYFNGGMDEFRFWTIAKSAADIRAGMHTRVTPFSDPNLVCYFRFDEGTGTYYTADESGNCNNGTLVNMDINNTSTSPVWYLSTIPLGAPAIDTLLVTGSGAVTFPNTNLSVNFTNYIGGATYYVHMFNKVPTGTQPTTTPGGITAVHPRTWIIYQYGTPTFTSADATFNLIANTLLPTAVNSDVKLFNRANGAGSGWALTQNAATALNISPAQATFTFGNAGQFNQQFVIGGNNNPLPIKLISFIARASENNSLLQWQTSSEENTEHFVIERSDDGVNFEQIGKQKAFGNHSDFNNYSFVDKGVGANHSKVFYRLRMIDFDGRTNFSNVQSVRFGRDVVSVTTQPNPFHDKLMISIYSREGGSTLVTLSDLQGKVVYSTSVITSIGQNDLSIQPTNLASGMYVLRVSNKEGFFTQKIVKE